MYWQPIYNVLEVDVRTLILVNAQHMKAVQGRKTDVKRCRLARRSLAPRAAAGQLHAIRELREPTRYRTTFVQNRTAEFNRLHKVLESANLKLAAVARDVLASSRWP